MGSQKAVMRNIALGLGGAITGAVVGLVLEHFVSQTMRLALIMVGFAIAGLFAGAFIAAYRTYALEMRQAAEISREKSTLISMVLHYIRTPITGIKWKLSELSAKDAAFNPQDFELLNDETERVLHAADRLLDTFQASDAQRAYSFEVMSIDQLFILVQEAINRLRPLIQSKKLVFEEDLPIIEGRVSVDKDKIRLVFSTVLENAVRYSNNGGTVRVDARSDPYRLRIKVTDTGIGIPDRDQPHIFLQFFRGSNAHEKETDGFGIGLFMGQLFMRKFGGGISFSSKEGVGSTFTLELPVMDKRSR